jgi:hypothetical protein
MESYSLLIKVVACCGFVLMHGSSYGQGRNLSKDQLDNIVKNDLDSCSPPAGSLKSGKTDPASIIPSANLKAFPRNRIAKTLNGIWLGKVLGDDGHVGVDYYLLNDVKRGEAIIIAQRSGKETVTGLAPQLVEKAPKLSFLMCAHEGYYPSKDTPQLHLFTKVSDNLNDAPKILQQSTGLTLATRQPTLSNLWKALVAQDYFNEVRFSDSHGAAYAGGLFKPLALQSVASELGRSAPSQISIKWEAEYRGGGATSLKFTNDVPVYGVEYAQFVGTSASGGDFLVSSPGNGKLWKVEAFRGATYDIAFDKVVLGPLQ